MQYKILYIIKHFYAFKTQMSMKIRFYFFQATHLNIKVHTTLHRPNQHFQFENPIFSLFFIQHIILYCPLFFLFPSTFEIGNVQYFIIRNSIKSLGNIISLKIICKNISFGCGTNVKLKHFVIVTKLCNGNTNYYYDYLLFYGIIEIKVAKLKKRFQR